MSFYHTDTTAAAGIGRKCDIRSALKRPPATWVANANGSGALQADAAAVSQSFTVGRSLRAASATGWFMPRSTKDTWSGLLGVLNRSGNDWAGLPATMDIRICGSQKECTGVRMVGSDESMTPWSWGKRPYEPARHAPVGRADAVRRQLLYSKDLLSNLSTNFAGETENDLFAVEYAVCLYTVPKGQKDN